MRSSNLASRSGLRFSTHGRYSYRSSSSSLRVNLSTGVRSTFSSDIIPPVPRLPNRDVQGSNKDRSNRSSMMCLSGLMTSSEAEALERAEEELLDVLGMTIQESKVSALRPHSALIASSWPGSLELTDLRRAQSKASHHSRTSSLPITARAHREAFVHNRDSEAFNALLNSGYP